MEIDSDNSDWEESRPPQPSLTKNTAKRTLKRSEEMSSPVSAAILDSSPTVQPTTSTSDDIQPPQEWESASDRSRHWAATIIIGICSDFPEAGSFLQLLNGVILIGAVEDADRYDQNNHSHLLVHYKNAQRKTRAVSDVLKELQSPQQDRVVPYAAPINSRPAYLNYMFKSRKDLLPAVVLKMNDLWGAKFPPGLGQEGPAESALGQVLIDLQTAFLDKDNNRPNWPDWWAAAVEKLGIERATSKSQVIKNFLQLWRVDSSGKRAHNYELAESMMGKKLRLTVNQFDAVTAIVKFLKAATVRVRLEPGEPRLHKCTRLLHASAIMTCMAAVKRPEMSNILMLWLSGPPGVGKSTLAAFICGMDERRKDVCGDATGVGRFQVNREEVIIFDEATVKQITAGENLRTLNSIADGRRTEVKIHGATCVIPCCWIIITGNVSLAQLMPEQDEGWAETTNEHSMHRRYMELAFTEKLTRVEELVSDEYREHSAEILSKVTSVFLSSSQALKLPIPHKTKVLLDLIEKFEYA